LGVDDWDPEGYRARLKEAAINGDWGHAESVLREMRGHFMPPDAACYAAALRACRRGAGGWKASELIEEMWKRDLEPTPTCYGDAIAACHAEGDEELATKLLEDQRSLGPAPEAERFHVVPKIGWCKELGVMSCGIHNMRAWSGKGALPYPPMQACWILPGQDESAVAIAENARALQNLGWKVIACDPNLVDILRNKSKLRALADELGLLRVMPRHYKVVGVARFPCILKPAIGTFGKNTFIIESEQDLARHLPSGLDTDSWVLQELIKGDLEYSTTLLVRDGEILDWACMRYRYDQQAYVWPHVKLVDQELVSVQRGHLRVMRGFLEGFSGFCNFNYKLRHDGSICIFETNPRIGGDLVFDLPKKRAREIFEKLDYMFT